MSDITKVGPPDKDDLPRKPNSFFERIWRGSWYVGLFNGIMTPLTVFRGAEFFKKDTAARREEASHGLQEAELSEEERQEGARRLHEEDARRRAGGE